MGHDVRLTASDGFQLGGYRADPVGPAKGALVVIQEIFGVNHHIRNVCDRYASEGYVAVAPSIFDRIEPNFQSGYSPDEVAVARKFVANPNWDAMLRDVQAAIDSVKDVGPVGIVGFCLGGSVAYVAAAKLSGLRAAVGYYGGAIVRFADDKQECRRCCTSARRIPAFRRATSRPSAPSGPMSRFTSIPARSTASVATSAPVTTRPAPISRASARWCSSPNTCLHKRVQNQRSPTTMVSPGLIGVAGGTTARMVPALEVWVRVTLSRLARGEKPPAMATALSAVIFGT